MSDESDEDGYISSSSSFVLCVRRCCCGAKLTAHQTTPFPDPPPPCEGPTFPSERFRTARKARGLCAHVPPLLHAWRRASVSAGRTRVSTSGLAQLARGARTRKRHAIRRMVPEPGSKHFLSLQGGRQVAEKRLRSTVFFTVACRVYWQP